MYAGACSRYDYEGVESEKAQKVMSTLRDIIADPSKVLPSFLWLLSERRPRETLYRRANCLQTRVHAAMSAVSHHLPWLRDQGNVPSHSILPCRATTGASSWMWRTTTSTRTPSMARRPPTRASASCSPTAAALSSACPAPALPEPPFGACQAATTLQLLQATCMQSHTVRHELLQEVPTSLTAAGGTAGVVVHVLILTCALPRHA
jgi:hypothetical protein